MNNAAVKQDPRLGLFPKIPIEHYHGKELSFAYSNSDLKEALLSAANVVARRNLPKDTDSLELGRALHSRIEFLDDVSKYDKLYVRAPKVDKRTIAGKAAFEQFEKESTGKVILSDKNYETVELALKGLCANPASLDLLKREGNLEETFVWQDPDTKVLCKCRPDKRILSHPLYGDNVVVDWKTTESCELRDLKKSVLIYKYHMQAALVTDGIKAVTGQDPGPFVNVFIEKSSGKTVCAILTDADIEIGRQQYKEALSKISAAEKSGIWTGFVDLTLPEWA